jgi:hypothetical protein
MTVLTKTSGTLEPASHRTKERFAAVRSWLADKIPTAVIVALIALYYIQLSHMG